MKTILVTGAAGFIGSSLIDALSKNTDQQIIGIDNFNNFYDLETKARNCSEHFTEQEIIGLAKQIQSPYRDFQNASLESINQSFKQTNLVSINKNNYKLHGVDLCDYQNLRQVFASNSITHIVNLAALAGVRPSTQHPVLYMKNNGESTTNLLSLAQEFKVQKFVQASSSSVYGARSKVPFCEDEDISKPISPYAASKVADEARLHCFHHLYKIPCIALRFFTVYGPRQRPDLAINKFAQKILKGETIEIYGDGSAKRDFTYIDDILDGVTKAIDHDCGFEIFNLGESRTTDVNTLIKLLEDCLGKKALVKYGECIPGDVPITFADISKAKSILGYNPQTDLEEGLAKFAKWLDKQKVTLTK